MRRHPQPILQRQDVPAVAGRFSDVSSVFNPGAIALDGQIHLLLRVQSRARETFLMRASSDDGARFEVAPALVEIAGLDEIPETLHHVYDPRITRLDGELYVVFAADTDAGCRLGIARGRGLERFELLSFDPDGDSRNGVLFPEKIGGRFARLERPNQVALDDGPTSGEEIVLSLSDDLLRWRIAGPVMSGRPRYWDERIGSGPPPVKTRAGWLHVYHGVATHFQSSNIYQAGVVLLDLADPTQVIARSWQNILEPRAPWELSGQVPNVVFPAGMVVGEPDETGFDPEGFAKPEARVRLYYGAADTCVGLATTTVGELIKAASE